MWVTCWTNLLYRWASAWARVTSASIDESYSNICRLFATALYTSSLCVLPCVSLGSSRYRGSFRLTRICAAKATSYGMSCSNSFTNFDTFPSALSCENQILLFNAFTQIEMSWNARRHLGSSLILKVLRISRSSSCSTVLLCMFGIDKLYR
jgi:hypothetical protein